MVVALSSISYIQAVLFALLGSPDVALVAVLIGTTFTLLFLALLDKFPSDVLERMAGLRGSRRRDALVGLIAAAFAFVVVWGALSMPYGKSVASEQIRLTPAAHADDVVTAILADFRGLDTLGEATAIAVALLGIATLLNWRRPRK